MVRHDGLDCFGFGIVLACLGCFSYGGGGGLMVEVEDFDVCLDPETTTLEDLLDFRLKKLNYHVTLCTGEVPICALRFGSTLACMADVLECDVYADYKLRYEQVMEGYRLAVNSLGGVDVNGFR